MVRNCALLSKIDYLQKVKGLFPLRIFTGTSIENRKSYQLNHLMEKTELKNELYNIIAQIIQTETKSILHELPKEKHTSSQRLFTPFIGWVKGEAALSYFFTLLHSYGFIACDYETFKMHFLGSETIAGQIKWLSYKKHLVYLFDMLQVHGFIPIHKHPHKLVRGHFLDSNGNELAADTLRTLLKDVRNNENAQVIEEIIHLMNKK
jgi:hypothetical protein